MNNTDTVPLLSTSDDETSASSEAEKPKHHLPLRGPSFDNINTLGVSFRESEDPEDNAFTGIDFREAVSLSADQRMDSLKEYNGSMQNNEDIESTHIKVVECLSQESLPTTSNSRMYDESARKTAPNALPSTYKGPYISDDSCWTSDHDSGNATCITGTAPALSEGKKYHVFFSYEISDRDWVEEVTRRLESPEFGFKCSIHERDFHGGKRIIENITEHIRISEKTVLVLSPDFIQSHWCMFEIELGMVLSMEESQLLVVPVMVKQCEVPDSIKTLTYIDATAGNDWWQRFMETITSKENLLTTLTGAKHLTIQPRYTNMDNLTELSSSFKCCWGEELRTPYIPDVLLRPGIQIPVEDFDHAWDILRFASRFWWTYIFDVAGCCVPLQIIFMLVGLGVMPLLFLAIYLKAKDNSEATAQNYSTVNEKLAAIFIGLSCPWIVFTIAFFAQKYMRKARLRKATKEANKIFMRNNVIIGFTVQTFASILFRIKLSFWYYNISDCQKQLAVFLRSSNTASMLNDVLDLSEVRAKTLIHQHSEEYTSAYIAGTLRPKHGPRHVRNAACLCQFIEEKYADGKDIPDIEVEY